MVACLNGVSNERPGKIVVVIDEATGENEEDGSLERWGRGEIKEDNLIWWCHSWSPSPLPTSSPVILYVVETLVVHFSYGSLHFLLSHILVTSQNFSMCLRLFSMFLIFDNKALVDKMNHGFFLRIVYPI